jgi:hypothetical protein
MQVKVPLLTVKFLLSQMHLSGKLAHWLAKIQEHDLMIMTSKMIKGCDLSLHLAQHPEPSEFSEDEDNLLSTLFYIENQNLTLFEHPWYKYLIHYLQFQRCPDHLNPHQQRRLHLEASKYLILGDSLFRRFVDGLLLRCIDDNATQKILNEIHGSTISIVHIGGHFIPNPLLLKSSGLVITGHPFLEIPMNLQGPVINAKSSLVENISLPCPYNLSFLIFPFLNGVYILLVLSTHHLSAGHVYILTTTYYFTKWVEVVPLRHAQDEHVIYFLGI